MAVCFCFVVFVDVARAQGTRIYQLQQSLIDNPRDTEALLHLAMEYSLQENFVKAVETYFDLLRLDPDNFHAYNNLGILYRKSGQFRDSLHCYQQAERINPDSYWVPYNMGLCFEAMGRMQEARESYGRALSLNPGFTQALERLRALSETSPSKIPALPGLEESQVYIVDSQTGRPRVLERQSEIVVAAPPVEKPVVKPTQVAQTAQQKPSEKIDQERQEPRKVRTNRSGPLAALFNQAMEALEEDNVERAIELYTRCVIAERDFLSEPENNLIRRGLEYLVDRPNRMTDGLFYRGFLIAISGNLELAVNDMRGYLEQIRSSGRDVDSQFAEEAERVIIRYEDHLAHLETLAKAREEEQEIAKMLAQGALHQGEGEEVQPRASDFIIKRMNVDQIIEEADRLSRSSRHQEAIAVVESGLANEPDNLRLLMRSANAYTDLMLLKNDNAAGQMALTRFERAYSIAPEGSKESEVSMMMIEELRKRR